MNYSSLGPTRLAVRGKDSESAHGSAQGVRLGQDQVDREVPRQSLPGCPKVCAAEKKPTQITTYVDSDWAGNKITRKSTSGGAMFLGKHLIKSWSSTQQVIALSSGEAELYGMLKGATQTKGLISMMADFGEENVVATVCSDASAAIGLAHRQQSRQQSSNAITDDKLACSVTKQTRRPQRRALRPWGV